jgi:hypothetical protein
MTTPAFPAAPRPPHRSPRAARWRNLAAGLAVAALTGCAAALAGCAAPDTGAVGPPPKDGTTPVELAVRRTGSALAHARGYLLRATETRPGRGTTVTYYDEADPHHRHALAQGPAEPAPVDATAEITASLTAPGVRIADTAPLAGHPAVHLSSDDRGTHRDLWVDTANYLPIRLRWARADGTGTADLGWLPRTPQALARYLPD